jgi:hypothetical protein
MASPALETVLYPFTAFNFAIEISKDGDATVCATRHSGMRRARDDDGSQDDARRRRERTRAAPHGPLSYGQLTLKRGMTASAICGTGSPP